MKKFEIKLNEFDSTIDLYNHVALLLPCYDQEVIDKALTADDIEMLADELDGLYLKNQQTVKIIYGE